MRYTIAFSAAAAVMLFAVWARDHQYRGIAEKAVEMFQVCASQGKQFRIAFYGKPECIK